MEDLSIIFPVHNERRSIEPVLQEWHTELTKSRLKYVFIVCEDGSTDGTSAFLRTLLKKYPMILDQVKRRRGYGAAVTDGIRRAASPYVLCVDSDGQCDPGDFSAFWSQRSTADIIIGWRKKRSDSMERKVYSGLFKRFFYLMFPVPVHDPSAPFVLFRRLTIIPGLPYLTYLSEGFWWGFVGWCKKKGLIMKEIPIRHRMRLAGETRVYTAQKLPGIVYRNLTGLVRLRFAAVS